MKRFLQGVLLLAVAAASLAAHDLFLKPFAFFVTPRAETRVRVLTGTFEKSESSVARNRIRDLSIVGPSGIEKADTVARSDTGDAHVPGGVG